MSQLMDIIKQRTSIRTFRPDPFWEDDKKKILDYANTVDNPYHIPITWRILDPKAYGLTSPVISGADTYLAGKMKKVPYAEEAFGYAFEDIVLFAEANGIGTTIIAGTMNRDAFEKAMEVASDEVMPCVTPLGYPAKKRGLKELAMRKAIGADKRIEVSEFVFDKTFAAPPAAEAAGDLSDLFEMVRWAPSAVNKQPWRLVVDGNRVHFYKKGSKAYVDPDTGWDIQKIDMGIAIMHFMAGAREKGLAVDFILEDPQFDAPDGISYTATCEIKR